MIAVLIAAALAAAVPQPTAVVPLTPEPELVSAASQWRLLAMDGAAAAAAPLPSGDPVAQTLAALRALPNRAGDGALAVFVRGSTQHIVVDGDSALVGWWNPIADAWVISDWRRGAAGWRPTAIAAVPGSGPSAVATDAAEGWRGSSRSFLQVLQDEHAARVRSFAAAAPRGFAAMVGTPGQMAAGWATLIGRVTHERETIGIAARKAGAGELQARIDAILIGDGIAAAPTSRFAMRLAALPMAVRTAYQPVLAVRQKGGGDAVLMQSRLAPAELILVVAGGKPSAHYLNLNTGDME